MRSMWNESPMSALMLAPSADEKVIDSSCAAPSCGSLLQTTFCTLVGNMTSCSVSGL